MLILWVIECSLFVMTQIGEFIQTQQGKPCMKCDPYSSPKSYVVYMHNDMTTKL